MGLLAIYENNLENGLFKVERVHFDEETVLLSTFVGEDIFWEKMERIKFLYPTDMTDVEGITIYQGDIVCLIMSILTQLHWLLKTYVMFIGMSWNQISASLLGMHILMKRMKTRVR